MVDGLKNANVSRTARLIVMGNAFGLLSSTGIDELPDLPTVRVSRPKEIIAGPLGPTVIIELFEVMVPVSESLATIVVLPFSTPVTMPAFTVTVAFAGEDDVKVNAPPDMK